MKISLNMFSRPLVPKWKTCELVCEKLTHYEKWRIKEWGDFLYAAWNNKFFLASVVRLNPEELNEIRAVWLEANKDTFSETKLEQLRCGELFYGGNQIMVADATVQRGHYIFVQDWDEKREHRIGYT